MWQGVGSGVTKAATAAGQYANETKQRKRTGVLTMANLDGLDEEESDLLGDDKAITEAAMEADPSSAAVMPAPSPAEVPGAAQDDVLKRYFARQKLNEQKLANAEDVASKNRLLARLGGAFNTVGAGLAGNSRPDNSDFDQMEKGADAPIARVERANKSALAGEDVVNRYMINKIKAENAAKIASANQEFRNKLFQNKTDAAAKADKLASDKFEEEKRHNQATEANSAASIDKKTQNMAPQDRAMVTTLATKNANKLSIASQIKANLSDWDSLPDDQKLARGRQMLKVLNSSEGADAVGTDEAKRLGSKLEFAFGNFTNGNPTQFGRDLKGFKEQALGTMKALQKSIDDNEAQISKITGSESKIGKQAPEEKRVIKKQVNKALKKTRLFYSDGTTEEVDGIE
jgi:hypothetical protein